jgi:uncharacterized small protein (DUF1192 family)
MIDIVERLSGPHEWGYRDLTSGKFIPDNTPFQAADEIERLRAEHERLTVGYEQLRETYLKAADEIERLRALLQRHDHDLSDAEDLLLEIANSMEKDFADPVAHVDWCMNAAKKYLIERAARVGCKKEKT